MPSRNKKFKKGFGILEVLISSAIIIVVLGTLVFIAQSSLTNAAYMQERAQAVSLAAEAIETVRQNRDSNYIDTDPLTKWNTVRGGPYDSVFPISYTYLNYSVSFTGSRLRISRYSTTTDPVAPIIINVDGVKYTRTISFKNIATDTTGMSNQLLTSPSINPSPPPLTTSDVGFEAVATVTWTGSGGKVGKVELRELITNSRFVY